ncbi:hypothetical protein FPRO04_09426 [Fusarium proliferatum]|nr:hypothetical protein FPRO04_09426 [Fusarium proliferatum]
MDKTPMLPEQMTIPWAPPPRPGFIFSGANIIDPVKGTVLENATVYLRDGIVKSINGDATEWSDDPSAVKMDLRGKFVCPGLIDCHVHLAAVPGMKNVEELKNMSLSVSLLRQPQVCKNMLERGFTTVRDCGGALTPLKLAIQDYVHPGPRLFIAGHALSQTGGHGDIREQLNEHECCGGTIQGIGRVIDGVPDCLKYTREELRQGVDFIKIMGGGGVASPTDKIEHVQFSDEEIKAIAVNQGVLAIEYGNLIDKETADLMAARGVFLTPTLVAYATMAKFEGFLPPDLAKKNREVLKKGLQAIKIAAEAGVTICFGSDFLRGLHFVQSHEFGLRS